MLSKLSAYWWPRMTADVNDHLRRCETCATRKPAIHRTVQQLSPDVIEPYQAGTAIDIDVLGPLPVSLSGNRFIVVFTDKVMTWPEAFATPYVTAQAVAKLFISQFVSRFGCPLRIRTDRGSNFASELIAHVNKLLGVQHQLSPPYSPWVQGSVERFNSTLASMLSHTTTGPDWDQLLPLVLFAYRTSECRATGVSSFELLYGRKPRLPLEASLISGEPTAQCAPDAREYLSTLSSRLRFVLHLAKRTEDAYRGSNSSLPEDRSLSSPRQPDLVMAYTPGHVQTVGSKFCQDWTGPYQVLSVQGEVRHVDSGKQTTAHRRNVKTVLPQ